MKKGYVKNNSMDKSIATGILALFSSLLFIGGSSLIYFYLLYNQKPNVIDGILLWLGTGVFLLGGIYLFIHGTVALIYNITLIKKKLPRPKNNDTIFINTDPVSGLLTFTISILFTLTIIFFLYPMYEENKVELAGLMTFIIFVILLLIYAIFILFYNLITRKQKSFPPFDKI